jgi:uncharacterized protein
MAKILISGGSGLIGKSLSQLLLKNKHEVQWLSREEGEYNGIRKFKCDIEKKEIDADAFKNVDVLINLAGAGIVDKRWTDSYKKSIINSRVDTSALLLDCIQKNNIRLKTFIGASAVGFYGSNMSEEVFTENQKAGDDFMALTCAEWENSYLPFQAYTQQQIVFRIGIVLAKNGGALKKMIVPFKFGMGSALGSGKQYLPWIHIYDLCALFLHGINNPSIKGAYNAVSGEIINNQQFSKALSKSLNRPYFLPNVPEFLLKTFLGERHLAITRGLKISNQKIVDTGFKFEFNHIDEALQNINHATTT